MGSQSLRFGGDCTSYDNSKGGVNGIVRVSRKKFTPFGWPRENSVLAQKEESKKAAYLEAFNFGGG